jgi:O-antigen/teichoic acid export membrane protein
MTCHPIKREVSSVKSVLRQWFRKHSVLLTSASSLVGTTIVTSGLGFVYWWVAVRLFAPAVVGLSSAAISVMTLLGTGCILGLGTLLIGELPRQPGKEAALISAALLLVGGIGGVSGTILAIAAPFISHALAPLGANFGAIALFAFGVSLTAITIVLDQAVIGLWQGGVQLFRNAFFSVAKLVLVFAAGFWLSSRIGLAIYATWAVGNLLSLLPLVGYALWKGGWSRAVYHPQWKLLWKLGPAALQHHALNLILRAPGLVLPVLVAILLSVTMNAWFYVAFMIANFIFSVPLALTTVLFAINSTETEALAQKIRLTLSISVTVTLLANIVTFFGTQPLLGLFGHMYAEQAAWSLRLLGLAALPLILKNHYVVLCRIQDQMARAILPLLAGLLLELGSATFGAYLGGLTGLSLGWGIALCIEGTLMSHRLYKAVRPLEVPLSRSIPFSLEVENTKESLHR